MSRRWDNRSTSACAALSRRVKRSTSARSSCSVGSCAASRLWCVFSVARSFRFSSRSCLSRSRMRSRSSWVWFCCRCSVADGSARRGCFWARSKLATFALGGLLGRIELLNSERAVCLFGAQRGECMGHRLLFLRKPTDFVLSLVVVVAEVGHLGSLERRFLCRGKARVFGLLKLATNLGQFACPLVACLLSLFELLAERFDEQGRSGGSGGGGRCDLGCGQVIACIQRSLSRQARATQSMRANTTAHTAVPTIGTPLHWQAFPTNSALLSDHTHPHDDLESFHFADGSRYMQRCPCGCSATELRPLQAAPAQARVRKFTDGPATWRGGDATIHGLLFRFLPAHEPKRKRPAWYAEYMRICAPCGKPVPESRRSHARYCSDECKKKAFAERRRKKPELVSVLAAAPPANPEQKASLLPTTVSQIAHVLVPSSGPEWCTTEYLTTDPAGRRVLVRIQQRVTIEFLPGASEKAPGRFEACRLMSLEWSRQSRKQCPARLNPRSRQSQHPLHLPRAISSHPALNLSRPPQAQFLRYSVAGTQLSRNWQSHQPNHQQSEGVSGRLASSRRLG